MARPEVADFGGVRLAGVRRDQAGRAAESGPDALQDEFEALIGLRGEEVGLVLAGVAYWTRNSMFGIDESTNGKPSGYAARLVGVSLASTATRSFAAPVRTLESANVLLSAASRWLNAGCGGGHWPMKLVNGWTRLARPRRLRPRWLRRTGRRASADRHGVLTVRLVGSTTCVKIVGQSRPHDVAEAGHTFAPRRRPARTAASGRRLRVQRPVAVPGESASRKQSRRRDRIGQQRRHRSAGRSKISAHICRRSASAGLRGACAAPQRS